MTASVVGFLLAAVVVPLLVNETGDLAPSLARCLIRWGARCIGHGEKAERYEEEWLADLQRVPGNVTKLVYACGILIWGVPSLRWQFRHADRHLVMSETPNGLIRGNGRSVINVLSDFQHGRCLICGNAIDANDHVAIDHVFPFSWMVRYTVTQGWPDLNLDTVWNLAVTHYTCCASKSDRPPSSLELERLARRNESIMRSPHPLSRTLRRTLENKSRSSTGSRTWPEFILAVLRSFS